MDDKPCDDCTSLVGAGPAREPHGALQALADVYGGKSVFRCGACKFDWASGPQGWARVVD